MKFFRKKKQEPKPEEDPTSLGFILIKMGACDLEQVKRAIEEQAAASEDRRIGIFLIAAGVLTQEALEAALLYQESLRSGSKHKQAIAESQIARHGANGVIDFAHATRAAVGAKVAHIKRQTSGKGHPAITENMLTAKAAED